MTADTAAGAVQTLTQHDQHQQDSHRGATLAEHPEVSQAMNCPDTAEDRRAAEDTAEVPVQEPAAVPVSAARTEAVAVPVQEPAGVHQRMEDIVLTWVAWQALHPASPDWSEEDPQPVAAVHNRPASPEVHRARSRKQAQTFHARP